MVKYMVKLMVKLTRSTWQTMMGTLGRIVQQGLLGARNIIQEHLEGPVREIYKVLNMSDVSRQGAEYVACIHNYAVVESEDELFLPESANLIAVCIYDKYSVGPVHIFDPYVPDAVLQGLICSRCAVIFIEPEYLS